MKSTEDNSDSKYNFWITHGHLYCRQQILPTQIQFYLCGYFSADRRQFRHWETLIIMVISVADKRQFQLQYKFHWWGRQKTIPTLNVTSDSNGHFYDRQQTVPTRIKIIFMRSTDDNSDSNIKVRFWSTEDISDADPVSWRWTIIWADRRHFQCSN